MIAPKGIATRQVGRIDTLATNHSWWTNSRHWTGRRKAARTVSSDIAAKPPASRKTHPAGVVMERGFPCLGSSVQTADSRVLNGSKVITRPDVHTAGSPLLKPRQQGSRASAVRTGAR